VAAGVAVLLAALLTSALHARVDVSETAAPEAPLPVAAAEFTTRESYQRELSFLGLVRAARVSRLGFEVPGTLASLPVREGSTVAAGDILAALDTAPLEARRAATSADLERVQAELELARIKAERQRDLQQTGAVSREAFDESRLRARALQAQLASVEARLRGIDIDLAKSLLRAPYDGVVAERLVDTGAVVNPGTPVLRLIASASREARIGIAAEQAAMLEPGRDYTLSLRGEKLRARLRSIRPDVDPRTLTTTAVFELPAGVRGLDGEPISLTLSERVAVPGGWLPVSALLESARGLWSVLRLEETASGFIAVREAVEVLAVHGSEAYVRGTLVDRQRYVADGVHRVAPGTPVFPTEG
jgi:RND family efflux transporter MFP subunit